LNILLINPSVYKTGYGRFKNLLEPMPCIGLAYICAILEKSGYSPTVIDNFVHNISNKEILLKISKLKPAVIGISALTPSFSNIKQLLKEIRNQFPEIVLILGNIHAEYCAKEILSEKTADIIVNGEGEYTFKDIIATIEKEEDLSKIPGISILKDGNFHKTPNRPPITDLDKLPLPSWHLFPYKKYGFFMGLGKPADKPILSILASRGCPYRCDFCSTVYSTWKHYRKRDPRKVVEEILFLIDRYKVKMLGFMDSEFPMDKDHAHKVLDLMIEANMGEKITWLTETRVDCVDQVILNKMKKAGCTKILYGFESGNQKFLDLVNKKITIDQSYRAVKMTKNAGILPVGLFMIGFPGETKKDIIKTFKFACDLNIDYAKFSILTPMPGSILFDRLKKEGKLKHFDWKNYTTFNPSPENFVYHPEQVQPEELIKLQKKGLRMFYLHPKRIYNHLFKIKSLSLSDMLNGAINMLFN